MAERVKGLFYDDPDRMTWVQPATGHVVASFDKALYDDYLCLVASNKHKFTWEEAKRQSENLENDQLPSE